MKQPYEMPNKQILTREKMEAVYSRLGDQFAAEYGYDVNGLDALYKYFIHRFGMMPQEVDNIFFNIP